MPMRPPRICGCGARVPAGTLCACQEQATRERKARAEANRPTARERGYTTKWQAARAVYLKQFPTCVRCKAPATVVDHIQKHGRDFSKGGLFWNRQNWQPLCALCHNGAKQSEEKSR